MALRRKELRGQSGRGLTRRDFFASLRLCAIFSPIPDSGMGFGAVRTLFRQRLLRRHSKQRAHLVG
jgi:hypothetical protein